MQSGSYIHRRGEIETYFDRTAADAWKRLTSDAPVSGIRATVRRGRDRMREMLLSYLPADLTGRRVLDAGCGTGAFAVEAARRGADVVAIDLSETLVSLARDRLPEDVRPGQVRFEVGDMLDPRLGRFDHVIAMDSFIHYAMPDLIRILETLASRTETSMAFTFAPRTPLLSVMHNVGRLFPRKDRAPAIVPTAPASLAGAITASPALRRFAIGRSERIASGFYTSEAMELVAR